MLALFFAHAALADEVPAWKYQPGTPYLYHIEADIRMPQGAKVKSEKNLDARFLAMHMTSDATCTPAREGKNVLLTCSFAWFGMTGTAWTKDQDKLDTILAEWSTGIRAVSVEILYGPDGRQKEFDVKRPAAKDFRNREIAEAQRAWLMRLFSPLHLPLPTDIKDYVRGWKDPVGTVIMGLPTTTGTLGAVELAHKDSGEEWGYARIESSGVGTITPGATVDAESGTFALDTRVGGVTLFDRNKGVIVYRGYTLDARTTASSSVVGSDAYLYQSSAMQLVDAFQPDGKPPLPISAQKAPRVKVEPPAATSELVPFAQLGMQPLYLSTMGDDARRIGLPTSTVRARVSVLASGGVDTVVVLDGYEALVPDVETALKAARFPARAQPYTVDVDVEVRRE